MFMTRTYKAIIKSPYKYVDAPNEPAAAILYKLSVVTEDELVNG